MSERSLFAALCDAILRPSKYIYLWTDDNGITHEIKQGEGAEQEDALMPALFSLDMNQALRQARTQLQDDELLIAYLDDLYSVGHRQKSY